MTICEITTTFLSLNLNFLVVKHAMRLQFLLKNHKIVKVIPNYITAQELLLQNSNLLLSKISQDQNHSYSVSMMHVWKHLKCSKTVIKSLACSESNDFLTKKVSRINLTKKQEKKKNDCNTPFLSIDTPFVVYSCEITKLVTL